MLPVTCADYLSFVCHYCPHSLTQFRSYTQGDNCESIWEANGLSTELFQVLNPFTTCGWLEPGDLICLSDGREHLPKPADMVCKNYTAKSGDTCSSVAATYGVSVDLFQSLNKRVNCTVNPSIAPGTLLCPYVVDSSLLHPDGWICNATVAAKAGDTCWGIAQAGAISLKQLEAWNPGLNCSNIWLGTSICLGWGPPVLCRCFYKASVWRIVCVCARDWTMTHIVCALGQGLILCVCAIGHRTMHVHDAETHMPSDGMTTCT